MYPSYFDGLYREAGGQDLGLGYSDFRQALVRIGASHLPPDSTARDTAAFYQALHLTDLTLAMACSLGLANAWEQFERRHRERLYSAALVLTRNDSLARELADSLFSELFVYRAGKLASYSGRGPSQGWLKALLAQAYVDRCRVHRRELTLDEQSLAIRRACVSGWCDASPVDPRLNDAIQQAFVNLPPESRFLLTTYFFDRQTLAEIAPVLAVHESTVSRRLDRLIRLLRIRIARLLSDRGMNARQVQECLQTDVREISLDLQSRLLGGAGFAGK